MDGENGFSFFDGSLLRFLFFYGLAGFCRAWLEGICYLLSNSVPLFFPEFLATASTHLVTTTAVPKLNPFHGRACPEIFGIRSAGPLTATSAPKLKLFILSSSDKKGTTSGAQASVNPLASFFLLHLLLSCYSFGLQ